MKATIWHNPKCGTSRKTLAILEETPGVEVEVIEYLKTPYSHAKLAQLIADAGMTPADAIRTMGTDAEERGLADMDANAILDAMAARDEPVSSLVDGLPHYAIHKTKIELDRNDIPSAFHALAAHFDDATHDRMDGLHLDWPDRWLLVRASNTEPIVRAIAEAPTEQDAADLCQQAAEIISDL